MGGGGGGGGLGAGYLANTLSNTGHNEHKLRHHSHKQISSLDFIFHGLTVV